MSTPEHGQSFRQFPPYVAQLGLARAPFARDDEAFFFAHPGFNQRLEMLLKQVDGEGLVMVSGEHDSGKSTLIKHLLACNDGSWRVCRIDAGVLTTRGTEDLLENAAAAGLAGIALTGPPSALARLDGAGGTADRLGLFLGTREERR